MRIIEVCSANSPKRLHVPGNYFLLDSVPGGVVDVVFFKGARRLDEDLTSVVAGWHATPPGGFDEIELTSSLTQSISFYVSRGVVGSNVFSGAVSVTNSVQNFAASHFSVAVSTVDVQLRPALAARKKLLIQNQHATSILYVRCDGAPATATPACIRLDPGQSWETENPPTGELRAIMSAVTAGDTVLVVEG